MTQYIRSFIFLVSLLLSLAGYAVDHIICNLTSAGIPSQATTNVAYSNIYTCVNTYPKSFPAIKLTGTVIGDMTGTSVGGTCTIYSLASSGSCQFNLNVTLNKTGTSTFNLQVGVGSLYYLNLPSVTTSIIVPQTGISWPGYNSGVAQADNSGVGTGSFSPDAIDRSGHTVIYTFAKTSGPGTVTGFQTGAFTLSGVDGTTVIVVTATADDSSPVVGTPITVQINNPIVPTKVLAFYNNSGETIYPIIEAPILTPKDAWLQAEFAIIAPNINTYLFTQTKIHRAYVNGTSGIPPGQTAFVNVPFYSNLVANPSGGNVPDEYVDWWNGMRVYLYDVQSNLITLYNADSANQVNLVTPGPNCLSGCSSIDVFSSSVGTPTNDPQQLIEYTFADVVTSTTIPYPIDRTHVDYDYSGVDQIYLPVALEPYGSTLVGYTGTTVDLVSFRNNMDIFISDTGWPLYSGLPYSRVPAAYNVVLGDPQLTNTIPATTSLTTTWNNCLNNTVAENHDNCVLVNNFFQTNYLQCFGAGSPTTADLLQHIYGWVAFTGACGPNPLDPTPGSGLAKVAYETLQYTYHPDYVGNFNPYVQLVHETLQMNVYAYSIDDATGNINTIGNGVVMAIGGSRGLSNPLQYDNKAITTVGPGNTGLNPYFNRFGVCSSTASTGSLAQGTSFSFQIPASSYPCMITLQDTNNVLYQFTLLQPAPFPAPPNSNYISCTGVVNPGWCSNVTINFGTKLNIDTPSPN